MASLADVTQVLRENNENHQLALMDNNTQLIQIRDILQNIEVKFSRFYSDYTEQITASLEAQAEAARQVQDTAGQVGQEDKETENKIGIPLLGLITSIAALSKFFGVDEVVRFPATVALLEDKFKAFSKPFNAIGNFFSRIGTAIDDMLKKAGTGQILKGDTFKVFGRFTSSIRGIIEAFKSPIETMKNIGTGIKNFLKPFFDLFRPLIDTIGTFLKPIGTLLSKLALPVTLVFAVIDGITGFVNEFKETGSIVDGLRGAVEEIFDGLVGGLIRIISSGIEFVLESLGFEDAAAGLGDMTDQLTEFLKTAVGGLFDALAGIFTFDVDRIIEGLTNMLPKSLQKVLGIGDGDSEPAPELTPQQEAKVQLSKTPGLAKMLEEEGVEATREFISESYGGRKQKQLLELLDTAAGPSEGATATTDQEVKLTPEQQESKKRKERIEQLESDLEGTYVFSSREADEKELARLKAEEAALSTSSAETVSEPTAESQPVAEPTQSFTPTTEQKSPKLRRAESLLRMAEAGGDPNEIAAAQQMVQVVQLEEKGPAGDSAASEVANARKSRALEQAAAAPNPALTAPVGQASQEVAAVGSAPTIVAPQTTNAPTTNNSTVTNINNATTVGSTSARPTEPSFMRVQDQYAGYF